MSNLRILEHIDNGFGLIFCYHEQRSSHIVFVFRDVCSAICQESIVSHECKITKSKLLSIQTHKD